MKLSSLLFLAESALATGCDPVLADGAKINGVELPESMMDGAVLDYNKCVYPVNMALPWLNANLWCQENIPTLPCGEHCKGRLVSFHTLTQQTTVQTFIHKEFGANSNDPLYWAWWIGLRQHCSDCPFEWNDLSPLDFTSWRPGEPNNAGSGEDCVQAYDEETFGWNDDGCGKLYKFICEVYTEKYHAPPDPWLPEGLPTTRGCKNGWLKFGGGCFRLFGTREDKANNVLQQAWHNANAQCQQLWAGASLAVMPNIHYQWFATSLLVETNEKTWIGMHSEAQDRQFHWVDRTQVTFANWAPGEPNGPNVGLDEGVVEMYPWTKIYGGSTNYAGEWNDLNANENRAYLCSHGAVAGETAGTDAQCPDGWSSNRHFCYKPFLDPKNFDESEADCRQQAANNGFKAEQGSLVSIVDEYEFNLARALLYPTFDVFNSHGDGQSERPAWWIGLTAYKATKDNGWIGAGDIIYAWNDKFPFSATYWSANQPNQKNIAIEPGKTCFFMNLPSGMWANSAATTCASALPRLCKINVDNVDPSAQPDNRGAQLPCPKAWTSINGRCYKPFGSKVPWFEAEAKCQALDGHLASIHSLSTNTQMTTLFASLGSNTEAFWIGGKRNEAAGLSWTDLSDFSFTRWDVNEPSEDWNGKPEDCVSLRSTGYWNDEYCQEDEHGYMCSATQYFSNCLAIAEPDRRACGAGLSERECDELKCCYDPHATIQCFAPQAKGQDGSMTAGKAAGITAGVFLALIVISLVYFLYLDK